MQRGALVALSLSVLSLAGCGGNEFTANKASAGSDAAAGGTETAAGGDDTSGAGVGAGGSGRAGGSSGGQPNGGSGGVSPAGGSGGSGGEPPIGCACPAGNYCRDSSTDCFKCSDFSRLHFTTPERLATVSDGGQGSRFPRVGESSTDLVYRFEGVGLRYTADLATSAGSALLKTAALDSGPLLLTEQVPTLPGGDKYAFNFAFDRPEGARRVLFIGKWTTDLEAPLAAPAPFNDAGSNYGWAIALHPTPNGASRAFWMSDQGMNLLVLRTALLTSNPTVAEVPLTVGTLKCPVDSADLTPWVTPDGKSLLFSSGRIGVACPTLLEIADKDLYIALLQPASGQPSSAGVQLSDVNGTKDDVDPSFSSDFCELYFSSNRDGDYAVYRAHRR